MNIEFDVEHDPPKSKLTELIYIARSMFIRGDQLGATVYVDGTNVESSDIAKDQAEFERQQHLIAGGRTLVVELEDANALSGKEQVAIPVDLGPLAGVPVAGHIARLAKSSGRRAYVLGLRRRMRQERRSSIAPQKTSDYARIHRMHTPRHYGDTCKNPQLN